MSPKAAAPAMTKATKNAVPRMRATRKGVLWSSLVMHGIAGVPNGMNQLLVKGPVNFGAQPADVGLDDPRLGVEMEVPDALEQHRAGEHPSFVAHQIFEQLEFPG